MVYLSPGSPLHLDACKGRDRERKLVWGVTGYILIPMAHLGEKGKGERTVYTSLTLLDYINYPSLCEVIVNGLTAE